MDCPHDFGIAREFLAHRFLVNRCGDRAMNETERVTDKTLRAWLNTGPVDRGIGGGLTFVATAAGALKGQASWILRYSFGGGAREKVLGPYPDLSLKDAREATRQNRARIQQGVDVAAEKRAERLKAHEQVAVAALAQAWYDRHIAKTYNHPGVVLRVIRRHIEPAIGKLGVTEVRPLHIDKVLTRILDAGAPTVANDALRHLFRMFHFAVKRRWIDANPVSGFEISERRRLRSLKTALAEPRGTCRIRQGHAGHAQLRSPERAGRVAAARPVRAQDGVAVGPVDRVRPGAWRLVAAPVAHEDEPVHRPVHRHPARGAGPAVAGGGPSVLVQQRVPVPVAPAEPHEGRCAEAEPLRPHQPGHAERRVAPPAAGRHRALHRA